MPKGEPALPRFRVGEWSLARVLLASLNIESIVLQLPRSLPRNHHGWYNKLHLVLRSHAPQDRGVLWSLRTLKLQSDTDGDPRSELEGYHTAHGSIGMMKVMWQACPALLRAPNLSVLEVMGHSSSGLILPSGITELSLSGFYTNNISSLVGYLPSGRSTVPPRLEKLTLHPFPETYGYNVLYSQRVDEISRSEMMEASRVLHKYDLLIWTFRNTLQSLDLQTMGRWSAMVACWTYSFNRQSRPSGMRCLPMMHRLEDLTIELGALLRYPRLCRGARLAEVFPPNLKSLVLIERWRPTCGNHLCQEDCPIADEPRAYAKAFVEMLNQFARDQLEGLPGLRRLTLVCNRAWRLSSLDGVPLCLGGCEERDPAIACTCVRGDRSGRDVYLHKRMNGSSGESFASAARRFARNGVVFDVGMLERGKYYRALGP